MLDDSAFSDTYLRSANWNFAVTCGSTSSEKPALFYQCFSFHVKEMYFACWGGREMVCGKKHTLLTSCSILNVSLCFFFQFYSRSYIYAGQLTFVHNLLTLLRETNTTKLAMEIIYLEN